MVHKCTLVPVTDRTLGQSDRTSPTISVPSPFQTGPNMSHASRDVHSARELVDLLSEPTGRLSGANIPELSSRSSTREIVGELAAELNVPWECSQVCHPLAQNAKAAAVCNSADSVPCRNAVSLRTITMRCVACHVASSSQLQCSLLVGQTGFATVCQLARFSLGLSTAAYFVGLWYWVRQSVNSVGPSCGSETRSSMNAYVLERLSENLFAYRCAFT